MSYRDKQMPYYAIAICFTYRKPISLLNSHLFCSSLYWTLMYTKVSPGILWIAVWWNLHLWCRYMRRYVWMCNTGKISMRYSWMFLNNNLILVQIIWWSFSCVWPKFDSKRKCKSNNNWPEFQYGKSLSFYWILIN